MRSVAAVIASLLAACASTSVAPTYASRNVALGRDFQLADGEEAGFEGTRLVVKFMRVVEESRCPMNARCISEGNAKIAVKVEEFAAKRTDTIKSVSQTFDLNTSERFAKRRSFGRFDVVLVHLEPTPMTGEKVRDYVATLRVEWLQ